MYNVKLTPDQNDPVNIIDICGDEQEGRPITKEIGYIESLNYPHNYLPNTRCECTLEVKQPESEVIITVLDMKIAAGKHGPVCEVMYWVIYLFIYLGFNVAFNTLYRSYHDG